ncbi:MAG TPA: hypothetical protein VKR42_12045 [Ktedonobacteraceae bacterium]|nr:hypothetical protein [Ktedonobacteraceae bacterium]
MATYQPSQPDKQKEPDDFTPASAQQKASGRRRPPDVAEARSQAQRAKLDTQTQAHQKQEQSKKSARKPKGETTQKALQSKRRAETTLACAIDDYLQDHDGGNHSAKTLEWHRTALGLLRTFLKEERSITLIGEVDAPDISA